MAEINREDLFSDDAMNAPKELAKSLGAVANSIDAITAASVKSEQQLKSSNSASKIIKETEQLTDQEKELIKVQNQISVALAKNNDEYIEQKKSLDVLNKIIKDKTNSVKAEENSIKSLILANAELKKKRDLLSTSTEEGRKKIAALNAQMDQNNTRIKDSSNAMEKQRMNIGNYSSALDGLKNGLSKTIPGVGGLTSGFQALGVGMTAANLPLLAIMGAIKLFTSVIEKSEPILDFFEDWFTKTSAVINAFVDNIKAVGEIAKAVFTGEFGKATDLTKKLGNALGNAANESQQLLERTRDLEDAEILYRIESAAAANQIKAWIVAAKNRNLTAEQSNALLQKASDKENEMTAMAVKNAQERADIEQATLVMKKRVSLEEKGLLIEQMELERGAAVSQKEYIDALTKSGVFSPQQLEPLVAAYEKVEQEASAGFALQEKITNSQAALFDKQAADAEKRKEKREKDAQEEIEMNRRVSEYIKKTIEGLTSTKIKAAEKEKRIRDEVLKSISDDINVQTELRTKFDDVILKSRQSINKKIEQANVESQQRNHDNLVKSLEETLYLYQEFSAAIAGLLSSVTERELQGLEMQKRANKDKLDKELSYAGNNEKEKERLKLEAAKVDSRIANEQLKLKQRQARFDKATALFNSGLNIATAITKAIPNPVLIALTAALGAIQIATIAAKPIPAFAKGTKSAPGGTSLVGELGMELLRSPNGNIGLTPDRPTIMNLPKGTEVIPNDQTLRTLALAGLQSSNTVPDQSMYNELKELRKDMKRGDDRIVEAILNSGGDIVTQGSLIYNVKKRHDGSRLKTRKKIMG